MIYTEQITLEQALDLQNIELPFRAYCSSFKKVDALNHFDIQDIYRNKGYLLISRFDYATYIIGNKPLPEVYGYPSKELSSGIYEGLEYLSVSNGTKWTFKLPIQDKLEQWWLYAFKLTDLTRVEAEAEKPFAEKYKEALAEPKPIMPAHFAEPITTPEVIDIREDIVQALMQKGWQFAKGDAESVTFKLFTPAITEVNLIKDKKSSGYQQSMSDALKVLKQYPEMIGCLDYPKELEDWKAKYSELEREKNGVVSNYALLKQDYERYKVDAERQITEATASADSKQDRINELEALLEKQRIDINNYCRAADKANEQAGEFWQLLLRTQQLNQQYQIALTHLI